MRSSSICLAASLLAALSISTMLSGEEIKDVIFSTRYASGRPTTADFEYNDRAIGRGREAFATIVEKIKTLPAGTSIVWGPSYDRCGACSGSEPSCVPKFLYPDLWDELELVVKRNGLVISRDYPGPRTRPVGNAGKFYWNVTPFAGHAPDPILAEPPEDERYAAILDWEVGEVCVGDVKPPDQTAVHGEALDNKRWHRFSAEGKVLHRFGVHLFLGHIPQSSRVLVRLKLNDNLDLANESDSPALVAENIQYVWQRELLEGLSHGKLKATMTSPAVLLKEIRRLADEARAAKVSWQNFHGSGTVNEEVLYEMNGRFVGRGNEGVDAILASIGRLPLGSAILLPKYEYRGRWVTETLSRDETNAKNAELRRMLPYATRAKEIDAAVADRKLKSYFSSTSPRGLTPRTVLDWNSGDRYGEAFVSFGRIVRHDDSPSSKAIRLGWTGYNSSDDTRGQVRAVENKATYTLDDVEYGQGVNGFAKAMDKLAALPEGTVVQVRVCIRTKGPFTCPLIFDGQRHFERTGFEPYFGMFPWLIDVAQRHKLTIEWLPDEQKSCADCELNK